jgi:hypothetical protein
MGFRHAVAPASSEGLGRRAQVVALSTYLPSRDRLGARLGDQAVHPGGAGAVPPVLVCHGKADTMVAYRHGRCRRPST